MIRREITVPGPFTMSQQAFNVHYPDARSLALDLAAAGQLSVSEAAETAAREEEQHRAEAAEEART